MHQSLIEQLLPVGKSIGLELRLRAIDGMAALRNVLVGMCIYIPLLGALYMLFQ